MVVGARNEINGVDNQPSEAPRRLKRDDLPIPVSDETWKVFEDIQKIHNMTIEFDPTWRNGKVSRNVLAQFSVNPSRFRIGIIIYCKNVTEDILAHEALHAQRIVRGHPFFLPVAFPERKTIQNLENEIQHFHIYELLTKMGFKSRQKDQERWRNGITILKTQIHKIPLQAPPYVLSVIGATNTLGGLVRGMDIRKIKKELPISLLPGISKGVQIYEELGRHDLSDSKENFKVRLSVASILGLTARDAVIERIDFLNRKRFLYDPISGNLLQVK